MRTARSSPYGEEGLCLGGLPDRDSPGQRPPDSDPATLDRDPIWTETPHPKGTWDQAQRPPFPEGTRDQVVRPPPSPWTEWLTHTCENIALLQTSFAGGKMRFWMVVFYISMWF